MTNPLIARFANEPALMEPNAAELFEACLTAVANHEKFNALLNSPTASSDTFWPDPKSREARYRPYIVQDGILQIPVKGVLLNGFPWAVDDWATGYEYIQRAFERGMSDPDVEAIALMIDSPGGMVAGNFDLVDKIFARRGEKPIRAFAHESAYSAAYSIASAADHIVVARTGGVGSIGVVTSHVDLSKALDKQGIKVTFIHAGKHKADGNPYEPLADDVKARIQARIDELYGVFVSTVARNRGMDEKAVRATEALTFTATQAVSNGLADSIGSLDDALAAFAADLSSKSGDEGMSKQDTAAVDQAAIDTARAEGVEQGRKEGASAERERIKAIFALDEAKDRQELATHLAMNTDMSADAAKGILAAAPVAKPAAAAPQGNTAAAGQTPFEAAMEQGNPDVGATLATEAENQQDDVLASLRGLGLVG